MTTLRHRAFAVVAIASSLLTVGNAAWSYFTSTGAGSGSAAVGTLAAPSNVVASASGTTVGLTWTGTPAPGGGPVDGYYVQRSPGAPGGTCASSAATLRPATPTSCSDTGLATGTYTYTVVAVHRSWTASAQSAPVTVSAAVADHFQVTAPPTATAGTGFSVTVTAQTVSNATATSYTGTKSIVWSGAGSAPNGSTPTYPASVTFANGVGTASVSLVKAETAALTASEGAITGTSGNIVVGHSAASQFSVVAPTPQVAGTAFNVTLSAGDVFGNPATGYTGPKSVAWTGPASSPSGTAPTYPATVTFTNGVGTASVTLVKAESVALTATQGTVTGTSSAILVNAGTAARLAWTQVVAGGTGDCLFVCNRTLGNNADFTARVSVTDALGNTVTNLGTGHTVTVSTPTSGAGTGGAFTAPAAGTSVTLTIAGTGAAASTATFTFRTQNGNWTTNTFSAAKLAGATYTNASATMTKNN